MRDIKRKKDLPDRVADVYLLIPGKLQKTKEESISSFFCENDIANRFIENINRSVEAEYNSNISQELCRRCCGTMQLRYVADDKEMTIHAVAALVTHATGICILEIIVQNCPVRETELLVQYCADSLKYVFNNQEFKLSDLLNTLNIRIFGKKRSIVFASGKVTDREIINALANEADPMGEIDGLFGEKIRHENIAQYNTAEVYVSSETMFERCKEIKSDMQRLEYQAIEIFFVELILFQDASVDKITKDLRLEVQKQNDICDIKAAGKRYDEISFEMAQTMQFSDYDQFKFPTVRASARKLARCFEIDYTYEKLAQNKELLTTMISINKSHREAQQDRIKNGFLLLISAVTIIATLGEVIYATLSDENGLISYGAAGILVLVCFLIYRVIVRCSTGKKKGK